MSEDQASTALPTAQPSTNSEETAKPTLEQAFAGEGGKSKLQSNLRRPKKLGTAAFNEGAEDLSGKSKKGKKSFADPKEDKDEQSVLFDKAPPEEKVDITKAKDIQEIKPKEKEPDASLPKKYKVKVNGEELEVTEEELLKGYQIRKASDKAFQEAAEQRKKNEAFIQKFKDKGGIMEVLQAFGHDPRKLAEEYLSDVLTYEMMTPEQQEITRLRHEKAQRDMEVKRTIEQQNTERAQMEQSKHAEVIQKSIIDTLEAHPDLPKDSNTVRRIIEQMRVRIKSQQHLPEHLREDVTPASVLDDVRSSIENDLKAKASQMTPEQLAKFLGKEKLDEYRKWELSQIKNPIRKTEKIEQNVPPGVPQRRHFKTMEEFRENQRQNGIKTFGGRF